VFAAPATAKSKHHLKVSHAPADTGTWWPKQDVQRIHLQFGPLAIQPGQNNIKFKVVNQRPPVDGWIVGFTPNLTYANGKVPPVDVIHLHHAVWLVNGHPQFGAGEEKTRVRMPQGFGMPYKTTDQWLLTYMIHNLTPNPTTVTVDYDVLFIPADSPAAAGIVPVWQGGADVQNGIYPVFDVHQGSGHNGKFTYPTDDPNAYPPGVHLNQRVVSNDATLVSAFVHLHPGGLYGSLYDTRVIDGVPKTVLLFRSLAHYFEPAGTVSWDVAMTNTPPDWRVAIKKGDIISTTATYNSAIGSWYESMGIMSALTTATPEGGLDPFTHDVAARGIVNHGHLPENDHHGGESIGLPDASTLPSGALATTPLPIDNFVYGRGDLTLGGQAGRPPTIRQGQSLTFVNDDAAVGPGEWHTITSCKAPCNAAAGIAYPLASAAPGQSFDSGELGIAGPPTAGRTTWSTPATLPAGTYTYFCRIHPFMRGAFRILPAQ
jgi:plastocyanin